jgi:hypothetical protein
MMISTTNEKYAGNVQLKMPQKNIYDDLVKNRRCFKCKKTKPGIEFHVDRAKKKNNGILCKECRKNGEQEKKEFLCPECNLRTNKIDLNFLCKKCNEKFGLKQCIKCAELKFVLVDFNTKKTICDDCC